MQASIRLLIIEDSADDAELVQRLLRQSGYEIAAERVDSTLGLTQALDKKWDVVISDYSMPQFSGSEALRMVRVGGRVIEVGNISSGLTVQLPPSVITFKSLEIIGVATYPPHYLKKSLDFLAANIDRLPYREMCDATFPLSRAAEALDKSERREVTRAGLLPEQN